MSAVASKITFDRAEDMRRQAARGMDSSVVVGQGLDDPVDDPLLGIDPSLLRAVALASAPVMIRGETGTGKELVAREIHEQSPRSGPFVAINCGALPETLLASELFGHSMGAFTGACEDKPGLLEWASGGTVFLDEIGDMSPGGQASLLRTLQEGEVRRVGGYQARKIDVRVIAAANRRLEPAYFREDLRYRLDVLRIDLPPLRERLGDIPLLLDRLLDRHANGAELPKVGRQHLDRLALLGWLGNVRELEGFARRALIFGMNAALEIQETIDRAESEPLKIEHGPVFDDLDDDATGLWDIAKRWAILQALRRDRGDRAVAAGRLGISRGSLYREIRRLCIEDRDYMRPGT